MKRRERFPVFVPLLVALAGTASAGSEENPSARRLEVEDYYAIESADEPAISPDGAFVAFTRHRIDEEKNRRRTELWLVPASDSGPPRRLSLPDFDASSPRYSPDGKWLAFVSRRDSDEPSVWFLRTDRYGEAFTIEGVDSLPVFSPDGSRIAYTRKTPPAAPRPALADREQKIESRFEGKIYDWMQVRYDRRGYLPDPRDLYESPPNELYLRSLTATSDSPVQITSLGVDVTEIAWSPDGGSLVVVADSHQRDEYEYERSDLWLVRLTASGSELERLTDDGYDHSAPAFSPDGRKIAFLQQEGLSRLVTRKAKSGAPLDLVVMDLKTRQTVNVTETSDLRPGAPTFDADGAGLSFEAEVSGSSHLFHAPAVAKAAVVQLTRGGRQLTGFSFTRDRAFMAYAGESSSAPGDVFVAHSNGTDERQLSHFGEESVARFSLSGATSVRYPSRDGTEVEGFVLLPEGYDRSQGPYPFVLAIHGGPHGAYGYDFDFELQLLAQQGYVVLFTNPRGSTGYGERFLWATWGGGWGNLDSEDVLAGVDVVRSRYAIDPKRMGITGYSYGGFLTNWIVTHDTRFAAAVTGAGISNWMSDYGTADIPRTKESEFFGPPWQDESGSLLRRQSPIEYVQNVKTPVLFVHGESDLRVPIEQGEQMYTALKKLRVPAKFIRYPGSYHGGWTPWNMVHRYAHELSWWSTYLRASESR
jgi:dipeptidyl aminopeptidase/acylaminoacyl peptidase